MNRTPQRSLTLDEAEEFDAMRAALVDAQYETEYGVTKVSTQEILAQQSKWLGLGAKERAVLSVILFITATIGGLALLLASQTVVLH